MDIFDAKFYWGRITRQDAEEILGEAGLKDGSFLVREKFDEAGTYAISLCFLKRFYHYRIDRLPNDNVILNGSRAQEQLSSNNDNTRLSNAQKLSKTLDQMEFSGPMELLRHFQVNTGSLITKLSIPCIRPLTHNYINFWCVPLLTPDLYMHKIIQEVSNTDPQIELKIKLTSKRYIYERRVLRTLHENEPWFHSCIGRHEAEYRLKNAGLNSGLFLLRAKRHDKRSNGSYTLSLCFQKEYHHYLIQETPTGHYQVASTNMSTRINQFGSLIHLIDFYHRHHQDLSCPLRYVCRRPGGSIKITPYQDFIKGNQSESSSSDTETRPGTPVENIDSSTLDKFFIAEKFVIFNEKIGEGQFGEVFMGKLIGNNENNHVLSNQTLKNVAIKRLRRTQWSNIKEFYKEGQRMLELDHPYILKIYGICKHESSVSLILELCSHGAMNRWLRQNKTFRMKFILNYMYQVSDGMNYLHEKRIIHRDLALRNILIVSTLECKISDFGLSRSLGENNYYQIGQNRRLPSIWYPPEVLETPLFHSQIDIWSFGITMWEAASYGQTPYKQELEEMSSSTFDPISRRILKFLQDGNRLKQPIGCPPEIYQLMLTCWEYDKRKRPTFNEIKQYLSSYAISKLDK